MMGLHSSVTRRLRPDSEPSRQARSGRSLSVTKGCFREVKLRWPLFCSEIEKWADVSRPKPDLRLPRMRTAGYRVERSLSAMVVLPHLGQSRHRVLPITAVRECPLSLRLNGLAVHFWIIKLRASGFAPCTFRSVTFKARTDSRLLPLEDHASANRPKCDTRPSCRQEAVIAAAKNRGKLASWANCKTYLGKSVRLGRT